MPTTNSAVETGSIFAMDEIDRCDSNGDPWWLLLLRAYRDRGTQGRLGLAYLAAARARLFGGGANAQGCLNEIRVNAVTGLGIVECPSSKKLMFAINSHDRDNNQFGLHLAASAETNLGSSDLDVACRTLVEEADAKLKAETPSLASVMTVHGFSYEFRPFSPDDLKMIDAVKGQLSQTVVE
jgi:hypothetical protein